jgi:hypothetical protein
MPDLLLDADRAPTLPASARVCANQHIDSVTVLHLKDLVQGFWQNPGLSQGAPESAFPAAAPGAPGRPLTSASARSTFLHRQGHMLLHLHGTAAAPGAGAGAPTGPNSYYRAVASALRFIGPEKPRERGTQERGGVLDRQAGKRSWQCTRKSTKFVPHGNHQPDAQITK